MMNVIFFYAIPPVNMEKGADGEEVKRRRGEGKRGV
jgi:hypothetical protein